MCSFLYPLLHHLPLAQFALVSYVSYIISLFFHLATHKRHLKIRHKKRDRKKTLCGKYKKKDLIAKKKVLVFLRFFLNMYKKFTKIR